MKRSINRENGFGARATRMLAAAAFAVLSTAGLAQAVTMFELVVGSNSSTVVNEDAAVTGSGYVRGPGLGIGSGGTFNSNGFDTGNTSFADAIAAGDFITWGFTSTSAFDLGVFDIAYDRSGSGPDNAQIEIDINDGNGFVVVFTDNSVSASSEINTLIDLTAFDNVTDATFRYSGFGSTSSGGTFDFENKLATSASFSLQGDLSPTGPGNSSDIAAVADGPTDFGTVIVGASVADSGITVSEVGGVDGADFAVSPGSNLTATPSTGTVLAGSSTGGSVTIGLDTATAGSVGSVDVNNLSNAGDTDNQTVAFTGTVLDVSNASFSSSFDANVFDANFGTVLQNDSVSDFTFEISNLEDTFGFTSDLDFDSFTLSAGTDTSVLDVNLATFTGLAAGGTSATFNVTFDTSAALGSYNETFTLSFSDEDVTGETFNDLTLNMSGTITDSLPSAAMLLTGVIDGPLSGGTPKAIELYVTEDIADLSLYGIGSANNGGGSDGEEFTLSGSASAGDYIYIATEATEFANFFGFAPDFTTSAMGVNGDDAIELFFDSNVIDVFGDINAVPGAWDYADGWAYRVDDTGPDGSTFVLGNWTFSGVDALDGETANSSAATPFPVGSFIIPEPATGLLLMAGGGLLALRNRREA